MEFSAKNLHDSGEEPPVKTAASSLNSGWASAFGTEFDWKQSVGGVRGILETTIPTVIFLVLYTFTTTLKWPLVFALAAAAVFMIIRLVQKSPLTQAISGFAGVFIGALWAWKSGSASDFFAWGILVSLGYFLLIFVSILLRWPIVGVVAGLISDRTHKWRRAKDPLSRVQRRRYYAATFIWLGLYILRLGVTVPLFLAHQAAALAVAKLVLGLPAFALAAWLTFLLVKDVYRRPVELAESAEVED